MAIQVRRGNEEDFDATKMLPGEWAVSLDTKYVRMCFTPGVCLRMATYEAFEEDMAKIEAILKECQDIEEAVFKIQTEINAVAIEVEEFASSAEENATKSQSYAVGGTGTRENENIDNAKYYYNQVKQVSQGINGIIPMGTVLFEELPDLQVGDSAFMYNVSNAFVSDERFNDGGGVSYGAGNNVFWTAEGKWDVTASSSVNGVKGSAEEDYRTGNVTITPEDLGLENVLPLLGDTDISEIGDGTVTGAINYIKLLVGLGGFRALNGVNDCNDIGIGYSAYVYANTPNAPTTAGGWQILCYGVNSNNKVQIACSNNDFAVRKQEGGSWSAWKTYLSTSGGTLNGVLNTSHIYPTSDGESNLGWFSGKAWKNVDANAFRMYKNSQSYGNLFIGAEGTETATGLSRLTLGNNKASGETGNSKSDIMLFGTGTGYTLLTPGNNGNENANVNFPKTSGTLMLKEDFTIEDGILTINLD